MTEVVRSMVGIAGLLVIAWLLSMNCRAIRPRVVIAALAMQLAIGALILFVPLGKSALAGAAIGVNNILSYGNKGIEFMFAGLVSPKMFELFGGSPAALAPAALLGAMVYAVTGPEESRAGLRWAMRSLRS